MHALQKRDRLLLLSTSFLQTQLRETFSLMVIIPGGRVSAKLGVRTQGHSTYVSCGVAAAYWH